MVKSGVFRLRVIVSAGQGWDHVSVSLPNRCPTWEEMDFVKNLFFKEDEVAMQLHVNGKTKINLHPYCLHLWRPQGKEEAQAERESWDKHGEGIPEWFFPDPIPMPPLIMV